MRSFSQDVVDRRKLTPRLQNIFHAHSDKHEFLNAYNKKKIKKEIQHFSGSDKPRMNFFCS